MDVEKNFFMAGGLGETSYARNSSLQKKATDVVKHITIDAVKKLYLSTTPKSLAIADLGCSSGPNTLSNIKDIVAAVEATSLNVLKTTPEFLIYLTDLPTNDFNTVFKTLPEFYREMETERDGGFPPSIFIAGCPGSFYGRLFPNSWLHFVHSSYSLHWLSKVPAGLYNEMGQSRNKGNIYISQSSPPEVSQSYSHQFHQDFSFFLRSRSAELIVGGRMVLIFLGRRCSSHIDRGNTFLWELLARSFRILISKGKVKEEKLDSYDVHFYAPCSAEIEEEVRRDGSFDMERLEMFNIAEASDVVNGQSYGSSVAMTARAVQQSMIAHHFGEEILDILFETYGKLVDEEMAMEKIKPVAFVLVLRKI